MSMFNETKMALPKSQRGLYNIAVMVSLLAKYLTPRLTVQEESFGRQTKNRANLQRGQRLRPSNQCALNKPLLAQAENPGPKLTGKGDDSRVNLIAVYTSKCSSTMLWGWFPVVVRPALCSVWMANITNAVEREPFALYPRAAQPPSDLVLCVSGSRIETEGRLCNLRVQRKRGTRQSG